MDRTIIPSYVPLFLNPRAFLCTEKGRSMMLCTAVYGVDFHKAADLLGKYVPCLSSKLTIFHCPNHDESSQLICLCLMHAHRNNSGHMAISRMLINILVQATPNCPLPAMSQYVWLIAARCCFMLLVCPTQKVDICCIWLAINFCSWLLLGISVAQY